LRSFVSVHRPRWQFIADGIGHAGVRADDESNGWLGYDDTPLSRVVANYSGPAHPIQLRAGWVRNEKLVRVAFRPIHHFDAVPLAQLASSDAESA